MSDNLARRRAASVVAMIALERSIVLTIGAIRGLSAQLRIFLERLDPEIIASLPPADAHRLAGLRATYGAIENTNARLREHDLGETA